MNILPPRLASIDVFRALTMLLMIFVNDFWTLREVPQWLEHTTATYDGIGLSDVVFPVFLFIVGLSLPFALQARIKKGATTASTVQYILLRGLALLVMGFFHVNLESIGEATPIIRPVFVILTTLAFFLIWLDYSPNTSKTLVRVLQFLGVGLLIALAAIYKNSDGGWMKPHWWGILGLIGWAYLWCAFIFLFSRGSLVVAVLAWLFFILFNMAAQSSIFESLEGVKDYVWIVGDGSMPALTMAGVITSTMYRRYWDNKQPKKFLVWLFVCGIAGIAVGFLIRPYWIFSKILATPSWVILCTGIGMLVFLFLVWFVDMQNKKDWFALIRPAGTSTLTCYLLPYIHYSIYAIVGYTLPLYLRTGAIGLFKSFLYALAIIVVVGILERFRLRLKV